MLFALPLAVSRRLAARACDKRLPPS